MNKYYNYNAINYAISDTSQDRCGKSRKGRSLEGRLQAFAVDCQLQQLDRLWDYNFSLHYRSTIYFAFMNVFAKKYMRPMRAGRLQDSATFGHQWRLLN
jgi:hypothetical protein